MDWCAIGAPMTRLTSSILSEEDEYLAVTCNQDVTKALTTRKSDLFSSFDVDVLDDMLAPSPSAAVANKKSLSLTASSHADNGPSPSPSLSRGDTLFRLCVSFLISQEALQRSALESSYARLTSSFLEYAFVWNPITFRLGRSLLETCESRQRSALERMALTFPTEPPKPPPSANGKRCGSGEWNGTTSTTPLRGTPMMKNHSSTSPDVPTPYRMTVAAAIRLRLPFLESSLTTPLKNVGVHYVMSITPPSPQPSATNKSSVPTSTTTTDTAGGSPLKTVCSTRKLRNPPTRRGRAEMEEGNEQQQQTQPHRPPVHTLLPLPQRSRRKLFSS